MRRIDIGVWNKRALDMAESELNEKTRVILALPTGDGFVFDSKIDAERQLISVIT
jgi:hypothetical protein